MSARPLSQRKVDWPIVAFFLINLPFITYVVDLEQLVIADPGSFVYPAWPPAPLVDLVHWWARNFDPLQWARPMWWKMTIWIDVLFFGPFYAFGLYAYVKGKSWIRKPSLIYGATLCTIVTIILGEEFAGAHATPKPLMVFLANLPWLAMPVYIVWRMWPDREPFE